MNRQVNKQEKRLENKILLSRKLNRQKQTVAIRFFFFLFACYPFFYMDKGLSGILYSTLSLLIAVLLLAGIHCNFIRNNQWALKKIEYPLDYFLLGIGAYELLSMIQKIITGDQGGFINFNMELMVILLILVYFIISSGMECQLQYFDWLLYSGLIIMAGLSAYFLIEIKDSLLIEYMASDSARSASYLILISTVGVVQYCFCKDFLRSIFYYSVSFISFFVLFLNGNMVGIFIVGVILFIIPLFTKPTAALIKKNVQMIFTFLFLLSNMPLIITFLKLTEMKQIVTLEGSIYIDLLIALGGLIFFHYWEKIPKSETSDKINLETLEHYMMEDIQKVYRNIVIGVGLIAASIVTIGNQWSNLPKSMVIAPFKKLAVAFSAEVSLRSGMFYECLSKQGLIIGIVLIVVMICMVKKVKQNICNECYFNTMVVLISCAGLLQMIVWKPFANTAPIYFIAMVFAAFYKEKVNC